MKQKKIPLKVSLTQNCVRWIHEVGEGEPPGRVASLILESCKEWKGDLFSLLFRIREKDKIQKDKA
tara:strand:+ start:684 stop:881 length:198 start_codon:yes stop_codon:yes gene_type:complete